MNQPGWLEEPLFTKQMVDADIFSLKLPKIPYLKQVKRPCSTLLLIGVYLLSGLGGFSVDLIKSGFESIRHVFNHYAK